MPKIAAHPLILLIVIQISSHLWYIQLSHPDRRGLHNKNLFSSVLTVPRG